MARRHADFVVGALLIVLLVPWPRMATAQVEALVDLTVGDHAQYLGSVPFAERMTMPPVVVTSHSTTEEPSVPFRVTLASLNVTSITPAGSFIYEVVLENSSSESIAFPRSTDESLFRRDMPGTTSMMTLLTFDDAALGSQGFGLLDAYGSPAIDGTLIAVPPGGSVRVRGRGTLALDDGRIRTVPWATRSVAVKARLSMWVIGKPVYRSVESINTVDLQIRER